MTDIVVKIKKASPDVPAPAYQTLGSAGCDIHASEDVLVWSKSCKLVPTGLSMEIPDGYECQIRPRSSLALKHGVIVFNTPSTIDSDYRGELFILLHNTRDVPFSVKKGDRVAQLVFAPVTRAEFVTVDELSKTERGEGGWGSTGV
jgi:dUTP pyrophosphatase